MHKLEKLFHVRKNKNKKCSYFDQQRRRRDKKCIKVERIFTLHEKIVKFTILSEVKVQFQPYYEEKKGEGVGVKLSIRSKLAA